MLSLGLALFVSAGTLRWPMAWVFLVFYSVLAVLSLAILDPALIAERSRVPPDVRRWDAVLAPVLFVFLFPGIMVVSGLDVRFGWSPRLSTGLEVAAMALFVAGYAFAWWAIRVNRFFAAFVRIQRERGHHVVDRGPYALVRHPGYAGTMLAHLALPIALGSLWGLLPAAAGTLLLALRAAWEDRTLADELAGYREYSERVRWRLVPGVW